MSYCTVQNVKNFMKGNVDFTTTTTPALVAVEEIIEGMSAIIDTKLSSRYLTPVTGAASLITLRQICVWLVLGELQHIMSGGLGNKDAKGTDYSALGNAILEAVMKGELFLSDATASTSSSNSGTNDFVNSNVDESREFTVKKDETQW